MQMTKGYVLEHEDGYYHPQNGDLVKITEAFIYTFREEAEAELDYLDDGFRVVKVARQVIVEIEDEEESKMDRSQEVSLAQYNQQYEQIMLAQPSHERSVRLAELMTEMEREFKISVFRFYEWAEREGNKEIASLYRKISRSRKD